MAEPDNAIRRATPETERQERNGAGLCLHCGAEVKQVPGGQGPTWVHGDGYVVCRPAGAES